MNSPAVPFTLRRFEPADAPALLALFRDTIRRVNNRDYKPDQITAWASDEIDSAAWAARFANRFAVVAEEAGRPVGFTELEDDGHVDRFYVSADRQRCGIGRALLTAIIDEARMRGIPRLYVEASITARAFFAALGFTELAKQIVVARDVEFVNYRMERRLG